MAVDNLPATYPALYAADRQCFLPLEPGYSQDAKNPAITLDEEGAWLAPAPDLTVDGKRVQERTRLEHRAIVQGGERRAYVFLKQEDYGLQSPAQIDEWLVAMLRRGLTGPRTTGLEPNSEELRFPDLLGSIALKAGETTVGRDASSDIPLPHPQVSRLHARIVVEGGRATIHDASSFNGTFVNAQRVRRARLLNVGDRIDIGPASFIFTGNSLFQQSAGEAIELVALNLSQSVPAEQGRKTLIDEVSLVVKPREFVCILGPSGSGKTVLMRALAGQLPAERGQVYLNRELLYANYDALKRHVAVVPQRDVMHEQLPLEHILDYTARLRLPDDLTAQDRQTCLQVVLADLGLEQHRRTTVSQLSGGQARRASLANEILSRPGVLFLDEVTSGLDEKTDAEMMRLFRSLADQGKTVLCITHNLMHVRFCDHLIVLSPGGKLAYFGPPSAALDFFGIASLGELYGQLTDERAAEWQAKYRASAPHTTYIQRRLPPDLGPQASSASSTRPRLGQTVRSFCRQAAILTERDATIKTVDGRWSGLLALQAIGLALLLAWLFGSLNNVSLTALERKELDELPARLAEQAQLPAYLLPMLSAGSKEAKQRVEAHWLEQKKGTLGLRLLVALAMCSLWLGCNNASGEIVRERRIFTKERQANLNAASYLVSKLVVLMLATGLQVAVLLAVVRWFTAMPGPFPQQLAVLLATASVGVLLGLAISAWAASTQSSTIAVPIVIIPQILLAGTFVPLEGLAAWCAAGFISLHWGYRGLVSQLAMEEDLRKTLQIVGSLSDYPASDVYASYLVLALHAALFLAAAYVGLRLDGARLWRAAVSRLWPAKRAT